MIGLILVPVQLCVELGPPAGDVPDPVLQVVVHLPLTGDGPPVPISDQPDSLPPDPLRLVSGLVRAVVVVHVGVRPLGGAELAVAVGSVSLPHAGA